MMFVKSERLIRIERHASYVNSRFGLTDRRPRVIKYSPMLTVRKDADDKEFSLSAQSRGTDQASRRT